jgi:type II secretory pathway pseudopilin PulG
VKELVAASLVLSLALVLPGCSKQEAKQNMEQAGQKAERAAEKAGEQAQKAAAKTEDAVKDATDSRPNEGLKDRAEEAKASRNQGKSSKSAARDRNASSR